MTKIKVSNWKWILTILLSLGMGVGTLSLSDSRWGIIAILIGILFIAATLLFIYVYLRLVGRSIITFDTYGLHLKCMSLFKTYNIDLQYDQITKMRWVYLVSFCSFSVTTKKRINIPQTIKGTNTTEVYLGMVNKKDADKLRKLVDDFNQRHGVETETDKIASQNDNM